MYADIHGVGEGGQDGKYDAVQDVFLPGCHHVQAEGRFVLVVAETQVVAQLPGYGYPGFAGKGCGGGGQHVEGGMHGGEVVGVGRRVGVDEEREGLEAVEIGSHAVEAKDVDGKSAIEIGSGRSVE